MTDRHLHVAELGLRSLLITRRFAAPPALVHDAHTDPAITSRWMRPAGWTLEIADQGGGSHRYVWTGAEGTMGMQLQFLQSERPGKIVHTERFDEDWTGGETTVMTLFTPDGDGTQMEMIIAYQSAAGRAQALAGGMTEGMDAGYAQLDALMADTG